LGVGYTGRCVIQSQTLSDRLRALVRDVPDFPRPGIVFRDITGILGDAGAFHDAVEAISAEHRDHRVDLVAGIESRGFIIGGAVALAMGAGFVPVRKGGRLPAATIAEAYSLEYGEAVIEVHADAIASGQRVLIVDDLLATGGTARATIELVKGVGGEVHALAFLIELVALDGRAKLAGEQIHAVLQY